MNSKWINKTSNLKGQTPTTPTWMVTSQTCPKRRKTRRQQTKRTLQGNKGWDHKMAETSSSMTRETQHITLKSPQISTTRLHSWTISIKRKKRRLTDRKWMTRSSTMIKCMKKRKWLLANLRIGNWQRTMDPSLRAGYRWERFWMIFKYIRRSKVFFKMINQVKKIRAWTTKIKEP